MNEEKEELGIELYQPTAIEMRQVFEAEIVKLKESADEAVKIEITDKASYEIVHTKQIELRDKRISIEKSRKAFTEHLDRQKDEAMDIQKKFIGILSPIEESLKQKKEQYNEEQERIKKQKELEEQMKINSRIEKFAAYGYAHDIFDLRMMEDARFEEILAEKKTAWEAIEKARLDKEESDRKEREDFEKKKAEQDAKDKEMADREAALAAREKAAEDEKLAKERAEDLEKQKKAVADQAIKDTEARMKREQEEKERREKEAEQERIRIAKEEQEKLDKKKKYIDFLASVGYTEENKSLYRIDRQTDPSKVIVMKIVWEFKI